LYSNKLIEDAADLYQLKYEDLIGLEKIIEDQETGKSKKLSLKEKSVENILDGINNSKDASFSRVLYAFGIRYVGETVAKKVANHFGSIEKLQNATIEELKKAPEVGDKIASSIIDWFTKEKNIKFISKVKAAGLNLKSEKSSSRLSEKLEGLSFVVSGVFGSFSRDELKSLIERHGGRAVSAISKKTSYLVAGNESGPNKLKKAESFKVEIISEEQFLNMIND
jgi:DNA ligase (NAD+)